MNMFIRCCSCFLLCILSLFALPDRSDAAETFRFERLWPTLQQPWYLKPNGIAVDDASGMLYVWSSEGSVVKLTPDGRLVRRWGHVGIGPGEFWNGGEGGIAVDKAGNVYVCDSGNHRIQKFTSQGEYVAACGGLGSGAGQFNLPRGITIDDARDILYVCDYGNNRVQVFTTDLQYLGRGGSYGSGPGQFIWASNIAVDPSGRVYVLDTFLGRVQRFTPAGQYIDEWNWGVSPLGSVSGALTFDGADQLYVGYRAGNRVRCLQWTDSGATVIREFTAREPGCMAVDGSGRLLVGESTWGTNCIELFALDGGFLGRWGSAGEAPGEFNAPLGLAVDDSRCLYVVEEMNHRVQRFAPDGTPLGVWGSFGTDPGQFNTPGGIAIDGAGNIYVTEKKGNRLQKFDRNMQHLATWGGVAGSGPGQFSYPYTVAVDGSGYVYVADHSNRRIQKFTSDGVYLMQWGSAGSGPGQFNATTGLAVDGNGHIWVSDDQTGFGRISEFTADGQYLSSIVFPGPVRAGCRNIAFDIHDILYVTEAWAGRVELFTKTGQSVGVLDNPPGDAYWPEGVAVAQDGTVYVADDGFSRIVKFSHLVLTSNAKAIVVAGGGAYVGNDLWDATQVSANFAYRALAYQGFTKETIHYLSSNMTLDLDNNGVADDVDGDATNANLQFALTTWAPQKLNGLPTSDVVVYLVDHGGPGTFRMSATETLLSSSFASWLDTLQAGIQGKVIVVYDACESGTFVESLAAPEYVGRRLVLTSTSPGESAYFVSSGTVSFSNYFWTQIFNGVSVGEAFDLASNAVSLSYTYQTPLLDDTGNGVGNEPGDGTVAAVTYIGNGTRQYWEAPEIGAVSPDQTINGTATATVWADPVTDPDGVARVWAVLRPPDFASSSSTNPVLGLPSVELFPASQDSPHWEGTYSGFTSAGTYTVLIYARDRQGNTSAPKMTTVTVTNPLRRKALLVAGGSPLDAKWSAIEAVGQWAYIALRAQGYDDTDIYYLSQTTTVGVDGLGVLANIQWALGTWARSSTQDLTVYLVGPGMPGAFRVNWAETLTGTQLDAWLDDLQTVLPGKATVVCDTDYSGGFLPLLPGPAGKDRIVLAGSSAGQMAQFLAGGGISFSKYFWGRVANGSTVLQAFTYAAQAMTFAGRGQSAALDDNQDGIYNTKTDGAVSRTYYIGSGILLAGDDPLIGSIVGDQTLTGSASATIWVDGVTTTGTIDHVAAVVTGPGIDEDVFKLLPAGGTRYEETYAGFSRPGTYRITVIAVDAEGNVSLPKQTTVIQTLNPDIYEDDDTPDQAVWIGVNAGEDQTHNSHDSGDADWVFFYARVTDGPVTVETRNLGTVSDTYIELYRSDGRALIHSNDNRGPGDLSSYLVWTVDADGYYRVKVTQSPYASPIPYGVGTDYDLRVWTATGGVRVGIGPAAARDAGATWRVDEGSWRGSGEIESGLAAGTHVVRFIPLSGWTRPADVNVRITANETATVSGTYSQVEQVNDAGNDEDDGNDQDSDDSSPSCVGIQVSAKTVYEEAMPAKIANDGAHETGENSALAVRLRDDAGIDPATVWGEVNRIRIATVAWKPIEEGVNTDGWVVYALDTLWTPGEEIRMTVGARTCAGDPIEPVSARFVVNETKETPDDAAVRVTPVSNNVSLPVLPEGVGGIYEIGPDRAYDAPQRVWLPVPPGVEAADLGVYYYYGSGDDAGWYPGKQVLGWLSGDGYTQTRMDGVTYLGFDVRHGGIVRLGVAGVANPNPAGTAPLGLFPANLGDLAALLAAGVLTVAIGRVRRGRRLRGNP